MKKKLSILAFGLLLAVGWTNVAQAQLKAESPAKVFAKSAVSPASKVSDRLANQEQKVSQTLFLREDANLSPINGSWKAPNRAPSRADYTVTADATHVYSWYDAITYDWVDANGTHTSKITEPASNPYQIAYLLGTTYMNPVIPGIKYSEGQQADVPYFNTYFGWDIPNNARWGNGEASAGTLYSDLTITIPTIDINLYSITVYNQSNTVLTQWNASNYPTSSITQDGNTYYYYTIENLGWSSSSYLFRFNVGSTYNPTYIGYTEGIITIPASLLNGNSSISVVIRAYGENGGETIEVNGERKTITTTAANYTWNINGSSNAGNVTPPVENGYTVFLVKVKDDTSDPPYYTYSWDEVVNYFDTYIDEVQLLTDGTRLNEGTDDAGTMFSYSGEVNRFYFISKGKMFYLYGSDLAPTCSMYEEFSPTSTAAGAEITDFYSKLLYGNSYNVIHDCQGVNALGHYFSMSGKNGSEHRSLTNLIFWIPDNRGVSGTRNYDEEYLPHTGLYTITLEATAAPSATQPGYYDITCDWVSSLNSILDFPVEQDYELWIYVYDEQGNPVEERLVTTTHDVTTYTYPEQQYPDSYTIIYRVKGWPTDATNNPARGGDFFALSNLDPVLIPGLNDFLSLGVEHYESDFAIAEEHNYYRNFMTVDNQNPDNALTAKRIEDGEDLFTLYRYDVAETDQLTKAADLLFSVEDNKVKYLIEYANQFYIDDADQTGMSQTLTGYKDLDALGCPTEGVIATLGGGGDTPPDPVDPVYETHTSSLVFTARCNGSGTADDGASWTVTSDANESTFDSSRGIHYGTNNARVSYLQLSTSDIPGTIKKIVVNASRGGNSNAYVNVTVGGNAFGSQQTLTSSAAEYTFEGEASGNIVVRISKNYTQGALFCKSIVVTYETQSGGESTSYIHNTWSWIGASDGTTLPTGWTISTGNSLVANGDGTWFLGGQTSTRSITIPASLLSGYTIDEVVISAKIDEGQTGKTISVNGQSKTLTNTLADYTWTNVNASNGIVITPTDGYVGLASITIKGSKPDPYAIGGYTLLNDFLDNSSYNQTGIVVFQLPWKSIQVKLQDSSAGTSAGYFMIQSGGKLRFIMPAGYNHANVKFVIHNAPINSNYHDGTFTLTSSTGETKTVTFATTEGSVDRECIFTDVSTGDVITITGTHTVDGTLYNYSPDFQFIRVYVHGGTGGISETQALNLAAIKFVDQFKAETKDDTHPYRYGYVLKYEGDEPQESAKPEVPVQHTNSNLDGFYTLSEIQNDTQAPLLTVNVMNANVNMTLAREPEIYYYTLDRKPNTAQSWEELSKLQRREDDSYQEMYDNLPEYDNQICNPPAITTPPTPWIVERYDDNVMVGSYNSYMSYVPIIWTHGDQKNRRVKWNTENRHNSYGAPIWKTGVAEVTLTSAIAQRQDDPSTKWTYGGEDCSLYMLDNIEAVAKLPTANNVNYVPYMFRIFVKSNNHLLRGYSLVAADEDPNLPGEHYVGAAINDDALQCVWSGYVNDENNERYGVSITEGEENGAKTFTFHKDKIDRTDPDGDWDKNMENAIFASIEELIQGEGDNMTIEGDDLTIVVRFYYLVEGFDASAPTRDGEGDPAGYGAEGEGFTPGPSTALNDLGYNYTIESVTYVNSLGMTSDKPFDGMNIVITRYTNGMVTTKKVVR